MAPLTQSSITDSSPILILPCFGHVHITTSLFSKLLCKGLICLCPVGFRRKEFRGKLAIAVTANFINRNTTAEAKVEEISGVAFIFNQRFFQDLRQATGTELFQCNLNITRGQRYQDHMYCTQLIFIFAQLGIFIFSMNEFIMRLKWCKHLSISFLCRNWSREYSILQRWHSLLCNDRQKTKSSGQRSHSARESSHDRMLCAAYRTHTIVRDFFFYFCCAGLCWHRDAAVQEKRGPECTAVVRSWSSWFLYQSSASFSGLCNQSLWAARCGHVWLYLHVRLWERSTGAPAQGTRSAGHSGGG